MGESNSKPQANQEFLRVFQREYKEIGEQNDSRLGNVKVFQGPQGNYVAVKNSFAYNKEDVENFLENNLPKALGVQNRYLMKVLSYKTHSEDSMCGSVNGITTYHEFYQNTVQDELVRRNQVNLFYIEPELWAILYSIISAAFYLEKSKLLPLSDIRPSNIYFTLRGEVKLLPFGIFPEDTSGYAKCFHNNEQNLLSPEQLNKMKERSLRADVDQAKSDIYSIGMTMLTCATLQTSATCYNYDDCSINQEFVNQLFTFSKSQYSKFFNNIINIMLSPNPEDRPSASTIYRILQPFENEILSLKPFNPDYETVKQSLSQGGQVNPLPEKQEQKLFSVEDQHIYENPQSNLNQSTVVQVPYLGEDGKVYYQNPPQQQYEYLIQQSDGQPIAQLENQFFYAEQPAPTQYVVQEAPSQQRPVYVSYNQDPQVQYVEYVQPQQSLPQGSYYTTSAQPQVFLNGAKQHYSQVISQPYQTYENNVNNGSASQVYLSSQPQVQYVQSNVPYGGQSGVVAQYSYNVEEKPFTSLPAQTIQSNLLQTGAPITYSHVNYNPVSPIMNNNNNNNNEEGIKKSMRPAQSDQQMINQDIYSNQIQQYNVPNSYTNIQQGQYEPESPIGLVSAGYTPNEITNTVAFQIGNNATYNTYTPTPAQTRSEAVQSSNGNYQPTPNASVNQQYTSSNYDINDINRRINEALNRTQNVLSNSNVGGKY